MAPKQKLMPKPKFRLEEVAVYEGCTVHRNFIPTTTTSTLPGFGKTTTATKMTTTSTTSESSSNQGGCRKFIPSSSSSSSVSNLFGFVKTSEDVCGTCGCPQSNHRKVVFMKQVPVWSWYDAGMSLVFGKK